MEDLKKFLQSYAGAIIGAIIAIIILYVQRTRNSNYRIERTGLWRKYDITWLKYSLIIERLLKWTRENKTYIKNTDKVDNEDFVRW